MRRAFEYGVWDLRISRKHPDVAAASPWRFLFRVSPLSRPLLLASVLVPTLARPLARVAARVALALDRWGWERVALAGATFVYGLEYFRGVRAEAGSRAAAVADRCRHLGLRRAARRDDAREETAPLHAAPRGSQSPDRPGLPVRRTS